MAKPPVALKGSFEKAATERLLDQFLEKMGIRKSDVVDLDKVIRGSMSAFRFHASNVLSFRIGRQAKDLPN